MSIKIYGDYLVDTAQKVLDKLDMNYGIILTACSASIRNILGNTPI